MALALEARAMADDIMIGDTPKARRRRGRVQGTMTRGRLWKHSTLADIEGLLPAPTLRELFAFTLVRNPWDRAVSYYHWLKVQNFDHPSVNLSRQLDFRDFVTHPNITEAFRNAPARSYMRWADGSEHCDAYIRIEHFNEDAAGLVRHLGFELELPIVNQSDRTRDYREYYSDSAAQAVADACRNDIDQFGYTFE